MTGLPEHNFPAFHAAAKRLQEAGWETVNPAENFGGRTDLPRESYLRADIELLAQCDAAAMLPGWEDSRGAKLEYLVAWELGMDVFDAETLQPVPPGAPVPGVHLHRLAVVRDQPMAERPTDTDAPLKDSGTRRQWATGAVRDSATGKGRFDLLPYFGLEAVARHFEAGAIKYAARNWEKGIPLWVYLDAAMRHAAKAAQGWVDEPHAEAACWNLLCYLHTRRMIEIGGLPGELARGTAAPFDVDEPAVIAASGDG